MTIERILTFTACAMTLLSCHTAQAQNNKSVKLSEITESYTMSKNQKTGNYIVDATQRLTYDILQNSTTPIRSVMHYDDNIVEKKHAGGSGDVSYRVVARHNIFNDDSKVAIVELSNYKAGKQYVHKFEWRYTDAHFFDLIPISRQYETDHYHAEFRLPSDAIGWEFECRGLKNEPNITKRTEKDGSRLITIDAYGIPAIPDEKMIPDSESLGAHIICKGAFSNMAELSSWLSEKNNVDCTIDDIDTFTANITKGSQTDLEKASSIFTWVQNNIRYVAFEQGEAGYVPDRPSEVLRKRYGDCKGMSCLLTTLLRSMGYEAYMMSVGSGWRASTLDDGASLLAFNHKVCLLRMNGNDYVLDATQRYMPMGYIQQAYQGHKCLVEETGETVTLPLEKDHTSQSITTEHLKLYKEEDGQYALQGTRSFTAKGETRLTILSILNDVKQNKQEEVLSRFLATRTMEVSNVTREGDTPTDSVVHIECDTRNHTGIIESDGEIILTPLTDATGWIMPQDTDKRRSGYDFGDKDEQILNVEITLPKGAKVEELPDEFTATNSYITLKVKYETRTDNKSKAQKIIAHCEVRTIDPIIPLSEMEKYNTYARSWRQHCSAGVVIRIE